MLKKNRILTIDIMRGLTLFLMLFVNDLNVKAVPWWLTHTKAEFDGMGLADWVFPGFLFMVGMAIPFAMQSRMKRGNTKPQIMFHILVRTISLLFIGVLMVNVSRLNEELSGISRNLWAVLMYISIFLIWNQYQLKNMKRIVLLKGVGFIGIVILVFLFKSGTSEEIIWIKTSWWGILGLIGWGYLVGALSYLFIKDSLLKAAVVWLVFIVLNILSQLNLLGVLDFAKPIFGVIINGNTPSMVLAGLFFSTLLRKTGKQNYLRFIVMASVLGILTLVSGFVLRNWFIISKIQGTPSWAMICNGISILLFVLLFIIIDVFGKQRWSLVFKPAGQNSLTTYLAPDILYYTIWMGGFPILFYKHAEHAIIVVLGSIAWAFIMIGFAALLAKAGIRLKL